MTAVIPPDSANDAHQPDIRQALDAALQRPGTLQSIASGEHSTMVAISQALLGPYSGFYTPDAALAERLAQAGALPVAVEDADVLFFPTLNADALVVLRTVAIRLAASANTRVTLVIGCAFASGGVFRWKGPGIQTVREVRLGGIPNGFWPLRAAPGEGLGWDTVFVDGAQVIGLPRTVQVERAD